MGDFRWAILNAANLHVADATGAIFRGADLTSVSLSGDFTGADFDSAFLEMGDFSWAILNTAKLSGANATGANFTLADLTGANLTDAILTGANATGANFTLADLTRADLTDASLFNANIAFAGLSHAKLSGANFTGANVTRSYLGDAVLTMAFLAGVDLTEVYLARADLSGADLREANLSEANLSEANLSGANLSGASLWKASLYSANLANVDLDFADLTDTFLLGVTSGGITGTPFALPEGWQLVGGVLVNIDLGVRRDSTDLADGENLHLGSLAMSDNLVATFTIVNTGDSNLTGLQVTKDGSNPGDFTVGALGSTTLIPNATTTFTVTFSPGAAGTRHVALHIASNFVGSKNPYDINLSGNGIANVAGRHIIYNQSIWDGNNAAATAADDSAIAPDKTALLPGSQATFANYTSYSRGINGLMVDIRGLAGVVTAADFVFKVGNDNNPASWPAAAAPSSVAIRAGAGVGGSDRVTLIFPNAAIAKQWLQVTVLANANTGLVTPDVFYFGNAVGESGNTTADAKVTSADALRVLDNITASTAVNNPNDHNRDGKVASADRLIVLNNLSALQPLVLLNLSSP